MKRSHGRIQGYNAQVMVEEASGVIMAQEVTAHSADSPRLRPMLERLDHSLETLGVLEEERRPKWLTAPGLRYSQGLGDAARGVSGPVGRSSRSPGPDPPTLSRE